MIWFLHSYSGSAFGITSDTYGQNDSYAYFLNDSDHHTA